MSLPGATLVERKANRGAVGEPVLPSKKRSVNVLETF
jgi:hypothetical protein